MNRLSCWCLVFLGLCLSYLVQAQTQAAGVTATVPRLVKFSGTLHDGAGKPLTGITGITFALYRDQSDGAPLWLETQNVTPDAIGHYTVSLGATQTDGLPMELFSSGEARWLGVQPSGQPEQPRVLLLSVPYALKAADAETVGGLPASAFVLAAPPSGGPSPSPENGGTPAPVVVPANPVDPDTITKNFIPLFADNAGTLSNSTLFQSGSGSSAKIGIGTNSPTATLDVKGTAAVRGNLALPSTGVATADAGKNSQPVSQAASAFNSTTQTPVAQTFRWQAEPVGNNTANASGSLNLLFGQGTAQPSETGLSIASNGQITFPPGQTFPGTGTITGVTAGTDLTGGGNSGNVTLNLDTAKTDARYAQLAAVNNFSAGQNIAGTLNVTAALGEKAVEGNGSIGVQGLGTSMGMYGAAPTLGIQGDALDTSGTTVGVLGTTASSTGAGVEGLAQPGVNAAGVRGIISGFGGSGVEGLSDVWVGVRGGSNSGVGVQGASTSSTGVFGSSSSTGQAGVWGQNFTSGGIGVAASTSGDSSAIDLQLISTAAGGYLIWGRAGANVPFTVRANGQVTNNTLFANNAASFTKDSATSPGTLAALQVQNAGGNGEVAWLAHTQSSNHSAVVKLVLPTSSTSNFLECHIPDGTRKCHITTAGTYVGGSDFAEALPVRSHRELYSPGDVLVMSSDGKTVEKTSARYSRRVVGVYSVRPAVLGAEKGGVSRVDPDDVPVAITGIVPTKVTIENGAIQVGDLLVTSSRPGYAMKATSPRQMLGAVVGKAMEPLTSGRSAIKVLVILR